MIARTLFAAAVALLVVSCGRDDPKTTGYDRNDTWNNGKELNGYAQDLHMVEMTADGQFKPREITVDVGETVSWKNMSKDVHTVSADVDLPPSAQPFHSGDIAPGASWSHTFSLTGTYPYYCGHHKDKGMTGTVVVRPLVK